MSHTQFPIPADTASVGIDLRLDLSRQQILHHLQIHQNAIKTDIDAALKQAIEETDFQALAVKKAKSIIERVMWESQQWGDFEQLIREQVRTVQKEMVEAQISILKEKLQ